MLMYTMKVYNTHQLVLLVQKKENLNYRSVHLFQSNQRFQAIEFVDRPDPEKL